VVFEADYDEIKLQKYSYDVTDYHYVTKKRHQNKCYKNFSNLGPFQSKFLATSVVIMNKFKMF